MTCAYAVRVALMKFPGVESAEVSLNKGLATVKLKPGNGIRPSQFWEAIRKNGNTPKVTHVVVRGEITGGGTQLKVPITLDGGRKAHEKQPGTCRVCDGIG